MASLLDGIEDQRFKEYYIKYCKYFKISIENEKSLLDFIHDVIYCNYNKYSYPYDINTNIGEFSVRNIENGYSPRGNYKNGDYWEGMLNRYIKEYEHIEWDK